jgi:hypothetical protein
VLDDVEPYRDQAEDHDLPDAPHRRPELLRRLSEDLGRCRYALVEGVTWRLGDAKRPLYDLAARNLGLAAQEQALRIPTSANKINLDMSRSEFRTRFFALPLRYVAMFLFIRPLLWILTLPKPLRIQVRHGLTRLARRYSRPRDTAWHRLIVGARDRRIVENLDKFFRVHGKIDTTTYAAIIFGAGHLPAISDGLRRLGFQVGTRRWVEVLRVPPEP